MNSLAPAMVAASCIWSKLASGRPRSRFSATVPVKRKASWLTYPMW